MPPGIYSLWIVGRSGGLLYNRVRCWCMAESGARVLNRIEFDVGEPHHRKYLVSVCRRISYKFQPLTLTTN